MTTKRDGWWPLSHAPKPETLKAAQKLGIFHPDNFMRAKTDAHDADIRAWAVKNLAFYIERPWIPTFLQAMAERPTLYQHLRSGENVEGGVERIGYLANMQVCSTPNILSGICSPYPWMITVIKEGTVNRDELLQRVNDERVILQKMSGWKEWNHPRQKILVYVDSEEFPGATPTKERLVAADYSLPNFSADPSVPSLDPSTPIPTRDFHLEIIPTTAVRRSRWLVNWCSFFEEARHEGEEPATFYRFGEEERRKPIVTPPPAQGIMEMRERKRKARW